MYNKLSLNSTGLISLQLAYMVDDGNPGIIFRPSTLIEVIPSLVIFSMLLQLLDTPINLLDAYKTSLNSNMV